MFSDTPIMMGLAMLLMCGVIWLAMWHTEKRLAAYDAQESARYATAIQQEERTWEE